MSNNRKNLCQEEIFHKKYLLYKNKYIALKNKYIQKGGETIDIAKTYSIIVDGTDYSNIKFYQPFSYNDNLKASLIENLDCTNYNIITPFSLKNGTLF